MDHAEMKNAPWLGGWMIAAAVGLVAFGVALVVGHLGAIASVAAAAVLCLIVGLVLGSVASPAVAAMPAVAPVAPVAPRMVAPVVAAPVMAAPVAAPVAPVAAPVPLMAADTPRRPEALSGPRGGVADDLKVIEGIGPKMEELCQSLGFFHFDQLASWTAAEIAWVDSNLPGFKGRVTRDKWVAQAELIVSDGMDEFLRRAKTNDY